jgi:lipoprotein-anchoring transpeptidase ErfK/SrfK
MSHWLTTAVRGLTVLTALVAFAAPAEAFYPYQTQPVWAPPPGYQWGPPRYTWRWPQAPSTRYHINPIFLRQIVAFSGREAAGTIIVDTPHKFLYFVLGNGRAIRYGIGTARSGFEWGGVHKITNKREWPDWTPPPEMIARQPGIPLHMAGGPNNPLGARALYIGSTLYRIHGTNEPWTIGGNVSSGCIRMMNEDVIDLYSRAKIGATVIVL